MRPELRRGIVAVAALSMLGLGGCTRVEEMLSAIPALNFMRVSPALDPYEAPRPAPPGSVPFSSPGERWEPPVERTEAALRAWGDTLTNPLPMSEAVLARGQEVWDVFCTVCHGPEGHGDGPLVGPGKFPFALDVTLPQAVQRTDGYLYAVTRVGRGLMPAYQRIPPSDRWAVVNYMRHLQQTDAGPAPETDPAAGDPAAADPEQTTPAQAEPAQDAETTVQGQE
jgi:mono/diheme cytochrome c family protein